MQRIIVVEDTPHTQVGIIDGIQETYERCKVDGASSVTEGKSKIDTSLRDGWPYDLVILDYFLPKETGFNPDGSHDLTNWALNKLPGAIIIEVSAFGDDQQLKEQLLQPRLRDPDPRFIYIDKRSKDWVREVVTIALQRLLGDPIADQLDDLFGRQSSLHSAQRARASRAAEGVSLTHRLATLRGSICDSWDYLSSDLKKRINDNFKVDESQKPIRITMF